jgi:hypothetical protein
MARGKQPYIAFNRGIISPRALARIDLEKMRMAAAEQTNWMPRALGSMMLRPGLKYIGEQLTFVRNLPFVKSARDTAIVEISENQVRIWDDGALVTSDAVTTTITNGSFATDLSGWTDADQSGATSDWITGIGMVLTGDGTAKAIRHQTITVAGANIGKRHQLYVRIVRGPVSLRIGSGVGGQQFLSEVTLKAGDHSIAFVPTSNATLWFSSAAVYGGAVGSMSIFAAGGPINLPSAWDRTKLELIRYRQSGDVIFVACEGVPPYRIERRQNNSWSLVEYAPEDGPFDNMNVGPIGISASDYTGQITLTATDNLFVNEHALGGMFRLSSKLQVRTAALGALNDFTASVKVTGVGQARSISIVIVGDTWTGTVALQRSIGEEGAWQDVDSYAFSTNTSLTYVDGLDNQIVYYRLQQTAWSVGVADVNLSASTGGAAGVVRITSVDSPTSAKAVVLKRLDSIGINRDWSENIWNGRRGWPTSVEIHDGRLWWAGLDRMTGSITDAFESFDQDFEGDAGPIIRSVGFGPVDNIPWLLSLNRLLVGTESMVLQCKASALDEPLTPTNFYPRKFATRGSAPIQAMEIDGTAVFVSSCGTRLFEIAFDGAEYGVQELTGMVPDLCDSGIKLIAIQRHPDTRIHIVLNDGTAVVGVVDRAENLLCFVTVETAGEIVDCVVLPGAIEDSVFYAVRRQVGNVTRTLLEQWAMESEAMGGAECYLSDSSVLSEGSPRVVITGLEHLNGRQVCVWADGKDLSPGTGPAQRLYTVASGQITLDQEVSTVVVGRPYAARFKSARLFTVTDDIGLNSKKRIAALGVVMMNTHPLGLQYGQDFGRMDDMPSIEAGAEVDTDQEHEEYEQPPFSFPGEWSTDARLCLAAQSPRPCTLLAAVVEMTSNRG